MDGIDRPRIVRRALFWAATALLVAWSLFPFWWGLAYSLKPASHLFDATLMPLIQFAPTGEHWQEEQLAAFAQDGMAAALLNGVEVGLGTALVALFLGLSAAFGLARFGHARLLVAGLAPGVALRSRR